MSGFEEFKAVRKNKEILFRAIVDMVWNYEIDDDVQTVTLYALWKLAKDCGLADEYTELIETYNRINSIDWSEWEDVLDD